MREGYVEGRLSIEVCGGKTGIQRCGEGQLVGKKGLIFPESTEGRGEKKKGGEKQGAPLRKENIKLSPGSNPIIPTTARGREKVGIRPNAD